MAKGKWSVERPHVSGPSKNKANVSKARRAAAAPKKSASRPAMSDEAFKKMFTKVSANDIMLSSSELKKFKKRYLSNMMAVNKYMGTSKPKPPTR